MVMWRCVHRVHGAVVLQSSNFYPVLDKVLLRLVFIVFVKIKRRNSK